MFVDLNILNLMYPLFPVGGVDNIIVKNFYSSKRRNWKEVYTYSLKENNLYKAFFDFIWFYFISFYFLGYRWKKRLYINTRSFKRLFIFGFFFAF